MNQGTHIFLSYAKEDSERVRRLYTKLAKSGMRVWLDAHDLLPGQDWEAIIRDAIQRSAAFVVLLSSRAVSKTGYVQKEIRVALDLAEHMPEGRVFIVPVRLEECNVPDRLGRWQWLDLFKRDGYERLLRALRHHAPSAIQPVRTPERPQFHDSSEQLLYELCRSSGRLWFGKLADGHYAFGQGHFMVVRDNFPSAFRHLVKELAGSKEVPSESLQSVIPTPSSIQSSWVRASTIETNMARGLVRLRGADKECCLDLKYWTLASLVSPAALVHIRGRFDPVYLTKSGKTLAVVMPRADSFDAAPVPKS